MLKKKMQELSLEQGQLEGKFEVIHDSAAIQIVGGDCGVLETCGTYTGTNCPGLKSCVTFSEQT